MKEKERRMAAELMGLSLEIMEKTGAHISFDLSNYGPIICIGVMEKGFQKGGDYEGWFTIPADVDDITKKIQDEEYMKAKSYLNGLLLREKEAGAA